jgi:predicted PurR-regulated permease PerM
MNRAGRIIWSDLPFVRWLQFFLYAGILLYLARDILIPVSFAMLISFVLYPVCAWFERHGAGRLSAIVLSLLMLLLLFALLTGLLVNQMIGFLNEWPSLQTKMVQSLASLSEGLDDALGFSKTRQQTLIDEVSKQMGRDFLGIVQNAIATSVFSVVILILIPVYVVLILYYRSYWVMILGKIFPHENRQSLREIIVLTIQAYYNFIKGMAIVYLLVGILNSVGLLLLGIPHAILFGFTASILTFIPYVGIVAGSLLPIAVAWLTYDSIWYPVGIIAVFTFVQYLEANVIFPFAVSNRLNVNALIMLISIFAGGVIWGVSGMILFVPFVGIAKLIADHNPKWRVLSLVLGTPNGKV